MSRHIKCGTTGWRDERALAHAANEFCRDTEFSAATQNSLSRQTS